VSGTCHYCGPTERELRPYGPGGEDICYPCMKESPEREEAAQNAFGAITGAASVLGPVIIGTTDDVAKFKELMDGGN
jgi:hypothetical protein